MNLFTNKWIELSDSAFFKEEAMFDLSLQFHSLKFSLASIIIYFKVKKIIKLNNQPCFHGLIIEKHESVEIS